MKKTSTIRSRSGKESAEGSESNGEEEAYHGDPSVSERVCRINAKCSAATGGLPTEYTENTERSWLGKPWAGESLREHFFLENIRIVI